MLPPKEFIKRIEPFSFLGDDEIELILENLEVEAFEEGEKIIKKGERSEYVYLVFSGRVGIYENGELVDQISKGEIFGLFQKNDREAIAEEDTICYLIKKKSFEELMERNKKFAEFFRSFEERKFRKISEILKEEIITDRIFLTKVKELISKKPVVCYPHTSIKEAAIKMEMSGVGSIVAVNADMRPVGILTSKDLRRFIMHGKTPDEKVSAYMSSPVVTIDADSPVFEAHLELLKRGINHLVITKNGRVEGVITANDILMLFEPTTSLVVLYRKLKKSRNIDEMRSAFINLKKSIAKLVLRGMHFYDLSSLLTDIYDYVVVKTIEIVLGEMEEEHGKLPEFVWVHMGSSARREQVIATDQDNALIHSGDGEVMLELGKRVCDALDYIGIPKCPGNYMASNPRWNMDVENWKRTFQEWFINLTSENVRYLSVFLDLRPIYGEKKLYRELVEEIKQSYTGQSLRFLAHDATMFEPPVGLFGLRRLKEVDIKMHGIYPVTNGVRVLALENGFIDITNTKDRLEKLGEIKLMEDDLLNSLKESYEFLQDLRLKKHSRALLEGEEVNANIVKLSEIDKIDALVLKESFKIISRFQKFLKGHYRIERGL
uniref:Cyclic nucleotide-binding/CBS domain-containing protein n=1 Tax=Archaeoglobus fulgidus TaxID=2234 RepID=A0A7C3MBK2_ARCFL